MEKTRFKNLWFETKRQGSERKAEFVTSVQCHTVLVQRPVRSFGLRGHLMCEEGWGNWLFGNLLV